MTKRLMACATVTALCSVGRFAVDVAPALTGLPQFLALAAIALCVIASWELMTRVVLAPRRTS